MLRSHSIVLVAAVVTSLLACGGTATRGEPSPLLGHNAVARTGVAPLLRAPPAAGQDVRAGAPVFREPRRLCELRGSRGSC
jgi:hypothetical protein